MPIPPFQANGTLPPGSHHATLGEIIATFPPISQERQELNQALSEIVMALGKLKPLAPDMVVYLNGSFITSKPSPNDLDMLILTDHLDEDQITAFLQQEAPIAALALDLYAERLTGGCQRTDHRRLFLHPDQSAQRADHPRLLSEGSDHHARHPTTHYE